MLSALRLYDLDPRLKLLMLAVLSTLALAVHDPLRLLALLLLTWAMLLLGGSDIKWLWKRARYLLALIAMIFLLQCLFRRDGAALLTLGQVTLLTSGGLLTAVEVALRLLIIISSALLALSGALRDYLLALSWFRLPDEVVYMVLAALRFLPLLREEARDVYAAMQMRGCDLAAASWLERGRLYLSLLLPVTAGALHRAERMAMAMEARGFRSQEQRSHWRRLAICRRDWWYGAAFVVIVVAMMILL